MTVQSSVATPTTIHREQNSAGARWRQLGVWVILALVLFALGLWNLDGPGMWWDEGWTLSVARNWAERGLYGRLRDGQPARPGLEASFTTTLPVGLTMRWLGVGLWQGRLFGVICAVAVILLLAALAARLYDRHVAVATVIVALGMTAHPQIHPLLQGRQVLAEMPMLTYLLAGCLCLWWTFTKHRLAILPAIVFLGLAWISKGQTAPFLVVALIAAILAALLARCHPIAALTAAALAGSFLIARIVPPLVYGALVDPTLPPDPMEGLLWMVAIVPTWFHRTYALQNLLSFGLLAVIGLVWEGRNLWRERAAARVGASTWYMRLILLAFCGSWLAWFLALSVGVPRYMAPPVVVASTFTATWLRDLTAGFDLRRSLAALGDLLTLRRPTRMGWMTLVALVVSAGALSLTMLSLTRFYPKYDRSAQRVAEWLNALPPGTRVETYESELHFLLNQPYTFPPDQLHVVLGLRSLLVKEHSPVVYDPLIHDPDYLVVGDFAHDNDLYAPTLASGQFRLVLKDGVYEVYERVRHSDAAPHSDSQ